MAFGSRIGPAGLSFPHLACGQFAPVEAPFKLSMSMVPLYLEIGEEVEGSIDEYVLWGPISGRKLA